MANTQNQDSTIKSEFDKHHKELYSKFLEKAKLKETDLVSVVIKKGNQKKADVFVYTYTVNYQFLDAGTIESGTVTLYLIEDEDGDLEWCLKILNPEGACLDVTAKGGARKKRVAKKAAATHKRTKRTHTGKDGVKRTVYTKDGNDYVMRRSKTTGKTRYVKV
jgi:hypothetical protein